MKTRTRVRSQASGLPKAVRDLLQPTAQSMDVSLEVWNGPGRASDRLNLSSACADCELQNPRTFDRCRKRRSYLSRPESRDTPVAAEDCPAKQRLTRFVAGEGEAALVLFAFGYELDGDDTGRDDDVQSFLHDMSTMLQEPLENLGELQDFSRVRDHGQERVPLLQAHGGRRPTDAPNWNQDILDQWCNVLQADHAFVWLRRQGVVAASQAPGVLPLPDKLQESLELYAQRQSDDMHRQDTSRHLGPLPDRHPLTRHAGKDLEAFCIALQLEGDNQGLLCGLRRGGFPEVTDVEGQLVQSLANEMSLKWSNGELVQGLNRFLVNTVKTLVSAIDAKDSYTSGHSERVNIISMLLGNELDLDLVDLESLYWSALLHDVGKIGLPESILNKPSPLEQDEFTIVQEHPERGWRMLHAVPELSRAAEGIRYHHERWDGTGYPKGLQGDDIPILARIICVADAFDAIVSNRSYRKGQSPTRAVELIEECVGEQFDPEVVAALRRLLPMLEKHRWVLMSGKKTSFHY